VIGTVRILRRMLRILRRPKISRYDETMSSIHEMGRA